jgi:hypothetical protein
VVKHAYMANGCLLCGAIQGNFPLYAALVSYRVEGGGYEALVVTEVEMPIAALSAEDDRDES